jgi:tRNA(Ile)-lysidine synthase
MSRPENRRAELRRATLRVVGARAIRPSVSGRRIEAAVRGAAARHRVALAVSGGRDSMVLLHAAARVLPASRLIVATFDHGTGAAASRAAQFVADEASRLGLPVVIGRAAGNTRTEAGWRAERHRFLEDVRRGFAGRVMTAHTRDDQVETVLMRVLRDAGARGLAGLYAESAILRPLLAFGRCHIDAYAAEEQVAWVEDPTNASGAHLRNRVRHDLLPALRRVAPDIGDALVDASARAASLRLTLDAWLDAHAKVVVEGNRVSVDMAALEPWDDAALALLWPALAARAGLAMDWRGTERAAAFTRKGKVGASIPLAGGWRITRARERFQLHRAPEAAVGDVPLEPGVRYGQWVFTTPPAPRASDEWGPWGALLDGPVRVRAWRAGDRMVANGLSRRVKRYLSDAGITGELRSRWPVVLKGEEIVWIPGVRRSDAASVRPGRPGVLHRCDYDRR